MTVARSFPTDSEVDRWLDAHLVDESNASPLADQLKAASEDTSGRIRGTAPYLVAGGHARWALVDGKPPDAGHQHLRSAARQYMATESAGITSLCPHTRQARPIVIHCDPPVAYCVDCHGPDIEAAMHAIGHLWNHQCDRCGGHAERLTPVTLSGLGHYVIVGHVCPACADHDRRQAVELADHVEVVGRRHPCPCGSAKRYKNCCGRRQEVAR